MINLKIKFRFSYWVYLLFVHYMLKCDTLHCKKVIYLDFQKYSRYSITIKVSFAFTSRRVLQLKTNEAIMLAESSLYAVT